MSAYFDERTFLQLEKLRRWPGLDEAIGLSNDLQSEGFVTQGSLRLALESPEQLVQQHNIRWARRVLRSRGGLRPGGKRLTIRQARAAISEDHNVRIIASAGTGKTLTAIGRVEHLISYREIPPEEILLLSFSRKAVGEMRDRLAAAGLQGVMVSTFHGLGNYITRKAGIPKQRVTKLSRDGRLEKFIGSFLDRLLKDPTTAPQALLYLAVATEPFMERAGAEEPGQYARFYGRKATRTLRNDEHEAPDSQEEVLIANFLYLHGVEYKLSKPCESPDFDGWDYSPDFQLRNADGHLVILEHFGVTRDLKPNTVCGNDYVRQAKGKLRRFASIKTPVHVTYSGDFASPTFFKDLRRDLEALGIIFGPIKSTEEIAKVLEERRARKALASTLKAFHTISRSKRISREQLYARATTWRERMFLDIYTAFVDAYQNRLKKRNERDFEQMIERAISALAEDQLPVPWSQVIVDEYQDVADIQVGLLQELRHCKDFDLFVVGDDRQAIYSWRGSEPKAIVDFDRQFGRSDTYALERTFRSNSVIMGAATSIVRRDASLSDRLRARRVNGTRIWLHDVPDELRDVGNSEEVAKTAGRALAITIIQQTNGRCLVLGRNGFHLPDVDIRKELVMNMHRAKGLEAREVVLVGFYRGGLGFPSTRRSEPLLRLVQPDDDPLNAEERVFFVALTRAFHKVHVLVDSTKPSDFALRLRNLPGVDWAGDVDPLHGRISDCPSCGRWGHLRLSRNYKTYYCSNRGFCQLKRIACRNEECLGLLEAAEDGFMRCLRCSRRWTACRQCGEGILLLRMDFRFAGCSRFNSTSADGCRSRRRAVSQMSRSEQLALSIPEDVLREMTGES